MIYLDNAATTAIAPEVVDAMLPYLTERFGNASAVYEPGNRNRNKIEEIRCQIADMIHAEPEEIYFTSGGSESDNWVIKMMAERYRGRNKHMLTDEIEHHAVLHTMQYVKKMGMKVSFVPVDKDGVISTEKFAKSIRNDTVFASVMMGNNEIGTIEPVGGIGRICQERGILFHTDAVQTFGHLPIDCKEMRMDFLSASAHKFHGPKGTGFLYAAKRTNVSPMIYGGGQERGVRAGTENVAGIVGMGKAAELAAEKMEENKKRETELRNYFTGRLLREIQGTELNGPKEERLPNNISIRFQNIEGESLLLLLDTREIYVSTGSACNSGSAETSHVLKAIGLTEDEARSTVRFTISDLTTKNEIDRAVSAVKECVRELRGS